MNRLSGPAKDVPLEQPLTAPTARGDHAGEGLLARLSSRIVGIYLGGSFSTGDFVPGTSDFDLRAL